MAYSNTLRRHAVLYPAELSAFLRMLAPFAPHITEELWGRLGQPYSVHQQRFPEPSSPAS
jgi:leucyl-tRNA synthetase